MEGGAENPAGVENVVEVQVAGAPEVGGEGELVAGRQVWVRVEAALQDVLVVSCGADGRHFQGVLLDCSKRNLPFGVSSLHPAFTQKSNTDNKLYSVSQRFAYEEPGYKPGVPAKTKQPLQRSKIRLRPRKVLCSKCKGICNENSENVVQTRKRKNNEVTSSAKERKSYASSESNSRNSTKNDRTLMMGNSLIPKLSRLHPNEISNALNGSTYNRNEIWIRQADDKSENNLDMQFSGKFKNMEGSGDSNGDCLEDFDKNHVLYSSSEKSSDNKFVDDREFDSESEQRGQKISQKCDGEISVHKKKRIENSSNNTDESSSSVFSNARTLKISFGEGEGTVVKLPVLTNSGEENSNPSFVKTDSKAARRAIKKAKKQARRQATPDTRPSSPLNETSYEIFQRKHKHKVKHKKKKKDEKKTKQASGDVSESETPDENHTCNLKNSLVNHVEETNEESLQNDDAEDMKMCDDSSSGWVNCEGGYSGVVTGDVVWGKLQGFPWWPGRVVSMGEEGHARVAWFASSTSSLVPFHRLASFLDNFKIHFNKKKRGPYKEAVRLATLEAGGPLDPLATDPLAPAPNNTLAPLSSPPIDVLS